MRKIIQIAYGQSETEDRIDTTLVALCNDGSLWWKKVESGDAVEPGVE